MDEFPPFLAVVGVLAVIMGFFRRPASLVGAGVSPVGPSAPPRRPTARLSG